VYELSLVGALSDIGPSLWSQFEGPETYPFLNYEWLLALEETACLGPERGWIPRHVVIRRGSEIVALAPAYIKLHSYGEFVFDQGWAEFAEIKLGQRYYPKLILAIPFTPATGTRILMLRGLGAKERQEVFDVLTGALPELAEKLGLSSVHILFPDERTADALEERSWILRLGLQFQFHNQNFSDFEQFLASFRSKKRASIRRERREVHNKKISIEVTNGETLRSADARLAHQLYLTTIDKHVWGRRYLSEGFFNRVMTRMPEAIHLVLARDNQNEVLGGAFNLLGKEALFGRYWGAFSEVPFLHFNVCLYRGIEECCERGLQRFEPGAGGAHKEGRGFAPTLTRSMHYIRDLDLRLAVEEFCAREAESYRRHVCGGQSGNLLSVLSK